jgi:Ala-tRNA(Pro) deacylase
MEQIYQKLNELNIEFNKREHAAVFTVQEADAHFKDVSGGHTKNVFLRNKNKSQYYLVVLESKKKLDLKSLAKQLGETRFSFGSPEKLQHLLSVTPGSVSPFGLMFDTEKELNVIIDQDLWNYETLHFHPNINTATLEIQSRDLRKFLDHCGHQVQTLSLPVIT